jgi:predicted permease
MGIDWQQVLIVVAMLAGTMAAIFAFAWCLSRLFPTTREPY